MVISNLALNLPPLRASRSAKSWTIARLSNQPQVLHENRCKPGSPPHSSTDESNTGIALARVRHPGRAQALSAIYSSHALTTAPKLLMPPRIYVDSPLAATDALCLGEGATRHTQVLRMQPGDPVRLFNGQGGEWVGVIVRMSRSETIVRVDAQDPCDRELSCSVTLAVGMPANERMDWLVEKAAELGASAIRPLECQRSVLRLSGARADKRLAHWQAVATAACEQSGRTAVPIIHPIQSAQSWLTSLPHSNPPRAARFVLSLRSTCSLSSALAHAGQLTSVVFMSGPEGGLTEEEEEAALAAGYQPVSLGPRTLRADTAPIAALAIVGNLCST